MTTVWCFYISSSLLVLQEANCCCQPGGERGLCGRLQSKWIWIKILQCRSANRKRLTSTQHKLHLHCVGWRSDEAKWFKQTDWLEAVIFRHTVNCRLRIITHDVTQQNSTFITWQFGAQWRNLNTDTSLRVVQLFKIDALIQDYCGNLMKHESCWNVHKSWSTAIEQKNCYFWWMVCMRDIKKSWVALAK